MKWPFRLNTINSLNLRFLSIRISQRLIIANSLNVGLYERGGI